MKDIWTLALLILVVVVLASRPIQETMRGMPSTSIASLAMSELTTGKLKIGTGSITRVAITDASMNTNQSGVVSRLFGNAPSHTAILKARLKYYINGGAIVALGKRFEVRGDGDSPQSADDVARREAAMVVADVQNALKARGLMP
jgi:hypothetical protein